jgi:hypothetical protein
VRKFLALTLTPLVILAGCGGGGSSTSPSPPPPPPPKQVIAPPGAPNVEGLILDAGPNSLTVPAVNTAFISVTVCIHGTTTCQTVDHVEVDTGSSGLRILAGASTTVPMVNFNLNLDPVLDSNNHPLAECLRFVDGTSWGSLNVADITLPNSGESATSVNVQVIGAASVGGPNGAPASCTGSPENTPPLFGANGILGVGPFINDCNSNGPCSPQTPPISAGYYTCPTSTTCTTTTVTLAQQVQNPAVLFATDNNGVIVELPAVGDTGSPGSTGPTDPVGSLVFGIGTRNNNGFNGATQLPMCPGSPQAGCQSPGTISANLNGTMYPNSYLDSGSNGDFFSSSLPPCSPANSPNSEFYCPTSVPAKQTVTLQGTNGVMLSADFNVGNALTLFGTPNVMFSNLAGPLTDNTTLDLGLSFFYGRNVFTGFEDTVTNAPPYFAY